MRSRGVRFPGRDHESLAPIFTPPRTVSSSEPSVNLAQHIQHEIPRENFTAEQTKEAFDVARNSVELLTTVLSSSPQQDALQVLLFYSYYHISISESEVIDLIHPQGITMDYQVLGLIILLIEYCSIIFLICHFSSCEITRIGTINETSFEA